MGKILVIGSKGQLGSELTPVLRKLFGKDIVMAADISMRVEEQDALHVQLNILDKLSLHALIVQHSIRTVYHLAAIHSVMGEQHPIRTWDVNTHGLLNVLEIARAESLKVFWPSSIAVFGGHAPRVVCPQHTVTEPATIYGISKLAGEQWCQFYHHQYGVDVRSVRYPSLIGPKVQTAGSVTDYALDMFHQALKQNTFACYLRSDTLLPIMYMPDAVQAAVRLMAAPAENINVRTAYNIFGLHCTPAELAAEIGKYLPGFTISYSPDFKQTIADNWPSSVDDRYARKSWGWKPTFDLAALTADMIGSLGKVYLRKQQIVKMRSI